jgi:transcriptional regulator with XRE-family HTH domain
MVADPPLVTFARLLRQLRRDAGLSQQQLAEKALVALRTINDLERGIALTARQETATRLADALELTGAGRASFMAVARGRASHILRVEPPRDADPHEWLAYVVRALDERGVAAARSALDQWQSRAAVEESWRAWADRLLTLTEEGWLPGDTHRPLPASDPDTFLAREQECTSLRGFLDRVRQGRGGLALIMGPSGIGKSRLAALVLAEGTGDARAEWITLDRGEAGYQGWRRLLRPLWATVRRTELAPASLLAHSPGLDDILLADPGAERAPWPLPGDVAEAIAALLAHVARRAPIILVIDDAHRGGLSSDHLLLNVARRVNAGRVGLIAALRPDELDPGSPLRGYCDQAGDREGTDVVTPVRVPPLDLGSIAALIESRQGSAPPQHVVEQVARQSGGRPQLINSIEIQRPVDGTGTGTWVVGGFGTVGLQVLRDTVDSRPAAAQDFLRAAAVCADRRFASPARIAALTDQPVGLVEQVLDAERQLGQILTPQAGRYCFQHDSWIEAITTACPPSTLRSLHARCLAILRDDSSADPRQLARHAVTASAELVNPAELAGLAEQAADVELRDCAFSSAAANYEVAARHTTGAAQTGLLISQADALRFCGQWKEARGVLQHAAQLARRSGAPGPEAVALVHLERLTWTYGLDEREVTQQLREVMTKLPRTEPTLLAQVQAGLAMRLGITQRAYDNEQENLARAALEHLPAVTDPLVRADILLGIRGGLHDIVPPGQLLEYDAEIEDLGVKANSAYHISEGITARFVDHARAGRMNDVLAAVRDHRDFLRRSSAPTLIYFQALAEGMLALARGDWEALGAALAEAGAQSAAWGDSVAGEALMAQAGWQLYETGQVAALNDFLDSLPTRDVSSLNGPVWELGAGLIHAENRETAPAIRRLHDVCDRTDDLRTVPRGPTRPAILATAAMVLGHPDICDVLQPEEGTRLGTSTAELLAASPCTFVVAGWPAVLLGSKDRYIGLAWLAAGRPDLAARHLARAVQDNTGLDVLQTRTQFDLARALMRQRDSYPQGLSELERAGQRAAQLGMRRLAEQAGAERERHPRPGP